MKIGFDAKRLYHNGSGLGNYSRDLVRMLATQYPSQEYLLYNPKPSSRYELRLAAVQERLPQDWISKKLPNLWRSSRIKTDLKADNIDIYHGLSAELPAGIADTGIKSVLTVHDLIFLRYPELYSYIDRGIYTRKVKAAVQQADQIVAISEQTKNDICEFLDVAPERIKVIYQGCHPAFKQPSTALQQQQLKEKLGLPEQFILNVGTVEKRKNALAIVQALAHIDMPLVIVGRHTAYVEELKSFAAKAQMSHRIFFVQGLSMQELACLYQAAVAFVYPSQFEGFGIPIIEALYAGTAVITNKFGVFPEAGGPQSYYIDPSSPEELQVAIEKVLADASLRDSMREAGLRYAQRFNDEVIASEYMDTYNALRK